MPLLALKDDIFLLGGGGEDCKMVSSDTEVRASDALSESIHS